MRRKMTGMVLAAVLILTMLPMAAQAADYSDSTFEYTRLADSTLSITRYTGVGGDVTIPSSYDPGSGAIAVTTIATNAFTGSAITSVTVPSSVTTIEGTSFNGCGSLISVTLSEGLSVIGSYAFFGCGALETVNIPSSVTSIGDNVFERCHHLHNVTLSNGLTVIGKEMFIDCTALESITIPSSVTSLGEFAFQNCSALHNVTLSDGLTTVGYCMFVGCTSLESITIPSSVTSIDYGAFASCGLKSITIPDSVTSMGRYAFNNSNLESVTLGSGLTSLSEDAFSYTSLESITIPSNITSIGESAFEGNTLSQRIVIAGKTVTFGTNAFWNTNLASDGIYGFSGSVVNTYADANNIPFHALTEVTYDSQGGSDVPYDYVITSGDTVDAPDDPMLSGHAFGGWYPTPACDTAALTFPYAVTTDTTLYAKWTPVYAVTFDSRGGNAVVSQSVLSGDKAAVPGDPTLSGHVFGGWYADEALIDAWDFDTDTVAANMTLYAKWTELTLTSSVASGKIYTGGRITLTPNIDGGQWDWDEDYFSATFNSPATFTALNAGTATITYTVDGVSTSYDVTIKESALPSTGQDFTWVWILCVTAVILVAGATFGTKKRKESATS